MKSPAETHRVLVLGAGYTGMAAAIRIARSTRRRGTQVTIVNQSSRFVERLRMHQVAAGQELGNFPIPRLLAGSGAEFVEGRVTGIDLGTRRVSVETLAGP